MDQDTETDGYSRTKRPPEKVEENTKALAADDDDADDVDDADDNVGICGHWPTTPTPTRNS